MTDQGFLENFEVRVPEEEDYFVPVLEIDDPSLPATVQLATPGGAITTGGGSLGTEDGELLETEDGQGLGL